MPKLEGLIDPSKLVQLPYKLGDSPRVAAEIFNFKIFLK